MPSEQRIRPWVVLGVSSLVIFTGYFAQYQIAALAYLLVPRLGLASADFSNLMFTPMLTAMVASIPLGILADRFGSRRVVGLCLLVALAGGVARVFATTYAGLLAAGMVFALAPAAMNANYIRLFGAWFDRRAGIAISVYYVFSGLGAALAMMLSASMGDAPHAFAASAGILAVLVVLWFAAVQDAPNRPEGAQGRPGVPAGGVRGRELPREFGVAARHRAVWAVALITGLGLASKSAYLGFLPQAFADAVSPEEANSLSAFVAWGGILGSLVGPLVMFDHRRPRVLVCAVNALAAVSMAVTVALLDSPQPALLVAVGVLSSLTAPMVEAVPAVLPELRGCVGSAGGVIGTASLALSYGLPLGISAAAGADFSLLLLLVCACTLATVPLLAVLPGLERASATKGD